MEAFAIRVRVIMGNYNTSTDFKLTQSHFVDVLINIIREEDLSMKLMEKEPNTLKKAVKIA